ncbi:hypothetical protein GY45DRAFT_1318718 [Cubamyces sp. BRFM 1775]|nr:hypothetical protein GY45DRAFT_1318718 [Cubamyces sp. BRFM 1775]
MHTKSAVLRLVQLLSFIASVSFAASASVNRTIDDQKGDSVTGATPLYLPETGIWNIGQTCSICVIRAGGDPIDTGEVFDGTWHDAVHYGTPGDPDLVIQASFTGHAVYVYHIVLNAAIPGVPITATNLAFYIDNEYVGAYTHKPGNGTTPPVLYQVPVYSNDSLVQGEHLIQIITSGKTPAVVLFDYIAYTTEEDDSQSSVVPPAQTNVLPPTSQANAPSSTTQMSSSYYAAPASTSPAAAQASHLPSSQGDASSLSSQTTATSPAAQPGGTSYVPQANASYPTPQPNAVSSPTPPNHQQARTSHVAAIAGATAGGVTAIAAACLLGALWRARVRRQRRTTQGALLGGSAQPALDKDHPSERGRHLIASTTLTPSEHKPASETSTDYSQLADLRETPVTESSLNTTTAKQELSVRLAQREVPTLPEREDSELHTQQSDTLEGMLRKSRPDQHGSEMDENNPAMLMALREEMSALRTLLETRQVNAMAYDVPPAYAR